MSNQEQIKRALAYLRAQKKLNVAVAAGKFFVSLLTLSNRFHSKSVSGEEVTG
jgi:hypothetical protein